MVQNALRPKSNWMGFADAPPECMETASGLAFSVSNRLYQPVAVEDIAHHLAGINRFNGACSRGGQPVFYSVAQHSCLVHDREQPATRHVRCHLLLHDAHEAYTGDQLRPHKRLRQLAEWNAIADAVQVRILEALGIPIATPLIAQRIKWNDVSVLAAEARDFMPSGGKTWNTDRVIAWPENRILPWSPSRSKREFLSRWEACKP